MNLFFYTIHHLFKTCQWVSELPFDSQIPFDAGRRRTATGSVGQTGILLEGGGVDMGSEAARLVYRYAETYGFKIPGDLSAVRFRTQAGKTGSVQPQQTDAAGQGARQSREARPSVPPAGGRFVGAPLVFSPEFTLVPSAIS